jgi:hypothetical protein
MLVFGLDDLDAILDIVVTNMPIHRSRKSRSIPANVIFLYARFAAKFGNFEMLDELLLGYIERVESVVHVRRCISMRRPGHANCLLYIGSIRLYNSLCFLAL